MQRCLDRLAGVLLSPAAARRRGSARRKTDLALTLEQEPALRESHVPRTDAAPATGTGSAYALFAKAVIGSDRGSSGRRIDRGVGQSDGTGDVVTKLARFGPGGFERLSLRECRIAAAPSGAARLDPEAIIVAASQASFLVPHSKSHIHGGDLHPCVEGLPGSTSSHPLGPRRRNFARSHKSNEF